MRSSWVVALFSSKAYCVNRVNYMKTFIRHSCQLIITTMIDVQVCQVEI